MRQVDYYTNAARYLGFIERGRNENNEVCYFLTSKGTNLFELHINQVFGLNLREFRAIKTILFDVRYKTNQAVYKGSMSRKDAKSQRKNQESKRITN